VTFPTDYQQFLNVLEIGPKATEAEIRTAYLTLVKVWHPDRFENDPILKRRAEEKLKEVNLAFDRISAFFLRNRTSGAFAEKSEPAAIPLFKSGGVHYYRDGCDALVSTDNSLDRIFARYVGSEAALVAFRPLADTRSLRVVSANDLFGETGQRIEARLKFETREIVLNAAAKSSIRAFLFFICMIHIRDILVRSNWQRVIGQLKRSLSELGWNQQQMFYEQSYLEAEHQLIIRVCRRIVESIDEKGVPSSLVAWVKDANAYWLSSGIEDVVRVLANKVLYDAPQREWMR
jgi:hypothetical protein